MSLLNLFVDFVKTDSVIDEQRRQFLRNKKFISFFVWKNLIYFKIVLSIYNKKHSSKQLDFIFWCSDETQWKNQFPVLRLLASKNMNVVVWSNKRRICNLVESLSYKSHYISTEYLLGSFGGLIKRLWYTVEKTTRDSSKLKWIVVGNDLRWDDRMVCKAFQMNGIRTAVINHGLNHIAERLRYLICDTHFAWSEKEKNLISESGCNPNRVQVSGSPALDEILYGETDPNQKLVDQFITARVSNRQDMILISFSGSGGQISEGNHRKNITYLKNQSEALKKNNFVAFIKLHPKDQLHYYQELLDSNVFYLIPKENIELNSNIFLWIKRAFALVSGPSTSMIDAMVMSKPAIYCDLDREGVKIGFVENHIVPIIGPNQSLIDILQSFKHDPQALTEQIEKQFDFLQSIYKKPDGLSASRIAEYLTTHG